MTALLIIILLTMASTSIFLYSYIFLYRYGLQLPSRNYHHFVINTFGRVVERIVADAGKGSSDFGDGTDGYVDTLIHTHSNERSLC
jgi:hypothetical protein